MIALAKGRRKLPAIAAALRGRLVNGLITDEATAEALLADGLSRARIAANPLIIRHLPARRADARFSH